MELREGVWSLSLMKIFSRRLEIDARKVTYEVGIPHSDRILHADFSHQQAIHPSESKLHEFYIL